MPGFFETASNLYKAAGGNAALGGLLGGLGSAGLSYGLNAKAASKAHDRSKNWATRKYQYELIALQQAGINPAYMFSNQGGKLLRSQQAQQQAPTNAKIDPVQAMLVGSQVDLQKAQATQARATAQRAASEARAADARADASSAQARLTTADARRAEVVANEIEKNPKLVRDKLVREGLPLNWAQTLVDGLSEVFKGPQGEDESWSPEQKAFGLIAGYLGLKELGPHITKGLELMKKRQFKAAGAAFVRAGQNNPKLRGILKRPGGMAMWMVGIAIVMGWTWFKTTDAYEPTVAPSEGFSEPPSTWDPNLFQE